MDMQIDTKTSSAAITDVYFDEPGGVSVTGNLKRKRAHLKHNSNGYSPYRMQVASRAKKSLEQVARLVVASDKKWKKKILDLAVPMNLTMNIEKEFVKKKKSPPVAHFKHYSPYWLTVACRAREAWKKLARLVVASNKKWKKWIHLI